MALKDTRELILESSLAVFSEKGYVSGTTLEISKRAGVSEMTLFRQFQTKNNLFLVTVEQAMGHSLKNDARMDFNSPLKVFISSLLYEKMMVISTNLLLIKMLIRETLSKTLPKELEFTKLISTQVINQIKAYVKHHNLKIDPEAFAQLVVGLLLRYAIMEEIPTYHLLNEKEKQSYLNHYIETLNI